MSEKLPAEKIKDTWKDSDDRKQLVDNIQKLLVLSCKDVPGQADKIMELLVNLEFFDSPASSNHHNNFQGGLAKHSLQVVKILFFLAKKYPEFKVSDNIAMKAGLLHDLCKGKIYVPNYNKDGSLSKKPFKIFDENPVGIHGDKSLYLLVRNGIFLSMEEEMMIRYHMATFDSLSPGFDKLKKRFPQIALMTIADQLATAVEDIAQGSPGEDD